MVTDPFVDKIGPDKNIFARGSVVFLKAALTKNNKAVAPNDGFQDHPKLVRVKMPDGSTFVDITTWLTNELDPDDSDDVYDATHATYTGATGIFHDGSGHIAAKVKIPGDAELTDEDPTKEWRVLWEIEKGTGSDPYVRKDEAFNVTASSTISFSAFPIAPSEITAGIHTSLGDPAIEALIHDTTQAVFGSVEMCSDIDPDKWTELPRPIRSIIIDIVRGTIFVRDVSAGERPLSVKEHTVTYRFGGDRSNEALANMFFDRAEKMLEKYCSRYSTRGGPMISVTRIQPQRGERLAEYDSRRAGEW